MKIAIAGHAHHTEYPSGWDLKVVCPLKRLANRLRAGDGQPILDDMVEQLKDREIVVYPSMGTNLDSDLNIILNAKNGDKIFQAPRRAFWSLDTHHWAGQEQQYVPKYFTGHYSSYPERLGKYAYFLPPGVWGLTPTQVRALPPATEDPLISVISLFRKYGKSKTVRDEKMEQYQGVLRTSGISFLAGQAEGFPVYLSLMSSARCTLNMSLDGEINARVFEALMFDHVVVTNNFATPRMAAYMREFEENGSLFYYDASEKDLDKFEAVVQKALQSVPRFPTREMIAKRHCVCHRISEIVFNESSDHTPKAGLEVAFP